MNELNERAENGKKLFSENIDKTLTVTDMYMLIEEAQKSGDALIDALNKAFYIGAYTGHTIK